MIRALAQNSTPTAMQVTCMVWVHLVIMNYVPAGIRAADHFAREKLNSKIVGIRR